MERDREVARLISVIRITAKMAMRLAWAGAGPEIGTFCVGQYNRVLTRLNELDPQFAPFFQVLPSDSSLNVAAMACRQLSAYYDDSARLSNRRHRRERRAHRAHSRPYRVGYVRF
jgi:hypothetical protein